MLYNLLYFVLVLSVFAFMMYPSIVKMVLDPSKALPSIFWNFVLMVIAIFTPGVYVSAYNVNSVLTFFNVLLLNLSMLLILIEALSSEELSNELPH